VIEKDPSQAVAIVTGIGSHRMLYQFTVGDSTYMDEEYVSGFKISMFSDLGLPLKTGDEFSIRYNVNDPSYNKIDHGQVSSETFNRYLKLAARALQRSRLDPLNSELRLSINKSRCLALSIYQQYGLEGLADCYHYDTHPLNRLSNNNITWHFFWDSTEMKSLKEACNVSF
jgi:hypothetical protein